MEWIIIIAACLLCYLIGFFLGGKFHKNNDDGIAIINEERVEVIFRDPYEKLIKKKFVNLRIQS